MTRRSAFIVSAAITATVLIVSFGYFAIGSKATSSSPLPAPLSTQAAQQDPSQPIAAGYLATASPSSDADSRRTSGLPASLQGSEPDGEITLDASGRVLITLGLRRLFDYFLSAIGELDVPAIRALLLTHVRELHGSAAAAEVAAIFDRYVDYQRALSAAESGLPRAMNQRLAFAKQLRRSFFDAAAATAFFGEEEAYAEYTLARMRIGRDPGIDQLARTEQLRALENTLTPEQRASVYEANSAVLAEEQSRQFDAMNLDPSNRHAERGAVFGEAAATRLADLDRARAAWDQRIALYLQARNAIRAHAAHTAAQRERLIRELRARSFDVNEAHRIASLESIGQL